eukprot:Pompholyxophrys_sp_v1_NODE_209_length_1166_cov_1.971197.p1 type:complete len:151 gc:universal NODE_209_length_1166_cov_1.971197:679-227(-)
MAVPWQSRGVEAMYSRFLAILKELMASSESNIIAARLLNVMSTREFFIYSMLLMKDSLPVMSKSSAIMQFEIADLSVFEKYLPAAIEQTEQFIDVTGEHLAGFEENIVKLETNGTQIKRNNGQSTSPRRLHCSARLSSFQIPHVPMVAAI